VERAPQARVADHATGEKFETVLDQLIEQLLPESEVTPYGLPECRVKPRLAEDVHPAVAAIEDMIDNAAIGGACGTWHGRQDTRLCRRATEKMDVGSQ
jgi:hypothetical protein